MHNSVAFYQNIKESCVVAIVVEPLTIFLVPNFFNFQIYVFEQFFLDELLDQ